MSAGSASADKITAAFGTVDAYLPMPPRNAHLLAAFGAAKDLILSGLVRLEAETFKKLADLKQQAFKGLVFLETPVDIP